MVARAEAARVEGKLNWGLTNISRANMSTSRSIPGGGPISASRSSALGSRARSERSRSASPANGIKTSMWLPSFEVGSPARPAHDDNMRSVLKQRSFYESLS